MLAVPARPVRLGDGSSEKNSDSHDSDLNSEKQDIHNARGASEAGAPWRLIIHRVWADRSHGCGWNRFTFAIR